MSARLLAIVEVDKKRGVLCQAQGCGHRVYRRIHVVRLDNGRLGVYGSDCFGHLFGDIVKKPPQYGGSSGAGRELTPAERQMLAENTEALIARFETEHQMRVEQARLRREREEQAQRAARERLAPRRSQVQRRSWALTPEELASVEAAAKAAVREKYHVDPDLDGWRGLVLVEARKLLRC